MHTFYTFLNAIMLGMTSYFGSFIRPMLNIKQDRWQSKALILSTSVDQKSIETEFSIAICRQTGDKWQSKTLFLEIFDPRWSTVKSVFDCRLSVVNIDSLEYAYLPP